MYEIKTADRPTNHKEFCIVKDAALERYRRLARHVPNGRMTRRRDAPAREKYAGSYTPIIAGHASTMAYAFHSDLYASGFALARPTLEALLKQALLTAYREDDDRWRKIVTKRTKVSRQSLEDMSARTGWADLSHRWTELAPVLGEFVHGGTGQLLNNPINEDGLPTYPGDWFWSAMFIATFSMLATSGWFWAHLKDEERARAVMSDMATEDWDTARTTRNGQTIRILGPNPPDNRLGPDA